MSRDRVGGCRRHIQQADGLLNHPPPSDVHKCAIVYKCGVERDKRVMCIGGVPGQVLLQHIPVILECLGKTPHRDPVAG